MIRKSLYILFLLSSVFSMAQVNFYSESNTKESRVNSPLVFTVVLEIFGEDLIQETPIKLPDFSKFNYEYASEQNTFIDPVKKIRINQMVYQFSLDPKQAGNIKIGSALVKVNGKMYKTEPIDISVKEAEKKPLASANNAYKNMYLNLQVDDREVYKDEPVVAVLKAFSRNISGFRHLETSKFGYSKKFVIRSIANFDETIEDSENNYSSQVIGMFVIVPKVAGVMEVPAAEVPLTGNHGSLFSNKVKINVKKLPEGAPEGFKDAVGNYKVKVELIDKGKENFEINKAFNVAVKVSGSGNLAPSIIPKILPSSDYETFEPKIVNNSKATSEGIEGEVEAQYVVIPKKRGDISIMTEAFSYFNPKDEKYVDLGSQSLVLKTVNAQDIANAKSTMQKVNEYTNTVLEKVDSPVINTQNLKITEHRSFNWKGMIGNLIIVALMSLALIYFNKKVREKKKREVEAVPTMPSIANIEETETMLRSREKLDVQSHLNYLNKKRDDKDISGFFTAFSDLQKDSEIYAKSHFDLDFPTYLKTTFGAAQAEQYKYLVSKVQVEKYAPFVTQEKLTEILADTEEVYQVF